MTLGLPLRLRRGCPFGAGHQVEPDPAKMATLHGAETPVLDWREKLVFSKCGGRQVDMVVAGTKR